MQEFHSDKEYFLWVETNPNSYIVHTKKRPGTTTFNLHKSDCSHVTSPHGIGEGAYTEKVSSKIGAATPDELRQWLYGHKKNFAGVFKGCKSCGTIEICQYTPVYHPKEIVQEQMLFAEGDMSEYITKRYKRSVEARKRCLEKYGSICAVCEFDFGKTYGEIGKGFMHIHHLKEIALIGEEYHVDAIKDLRPVCPNCHYMLHRQIPCFTIEELTEIVRLQKINPTHTPS